MFTASFLVNSIKRKMRAFFLRWSENTRHANKRGERMGKKLYSVSFLDGDENRNGKHDGRTESEDEMRKTKYV